jgi:hypothetical protein
MMHGGGARGVPPPTSRKDAPMAEWTYAQQDAVEELALLHQFAFKKAQPDGDVEFTITVKEYAERNALHMRFFAQADREVNQGVAPFVPFGWGPTLLDALTECLKGVRQYPCRPGAARAT